MSSLSTPHKEIVTLNPSILAADYLNLESELEKICTADAVHVDVMDNHFVPNLSIGQPVVAQIQKVSSIPLDVHLMIDDPDRWALEYAEMGVDSITFHAEAVTAPIRLAKALRTKGVKAGVAFRPATSLEGYIPFLDEFDRILIMTVEPGFGGQKFLPQTMEKVHQVRHLVTENNLILDLQVDGGITESTIKTAARSGANSFVAGSSVFETPNPQQAVALLKKEAVKARESS